MQKRFLSNTYTPDGKLEARYLITDASWWDRLLYFTWQSTFVVIESTVLARHVPRRIQDERLRVLRETSRL